MAVELERYLESVLRLPRMSKEDREFLNRLLDEAEEHLFVQKGKQLKENLTVAFDRYQTETHTPKLIWETWKVFWDLFAHRSKMTIDSPAPYLSQQQLQEIESTGNMLIYLPSQLSSPKEWETLVRGFDQDRGSYPLSAFHFNGYPYDSSQFDYLRRGGFRNLLNQSGWLQTEAQITPPHQSQGLENIQLEFEKLGWEGMTLNSYLVVTYFAHGLKQTLDDTVYGHNFPANFCALLGTRSQNEILCIASQDMGGAVGFSVYAIGSNKLSEYQKQLTGARSVLSLGALVQKRLF